MVVKPLYHLLSVMGWSLTRIDQEVQDGTIELVRKNGRTGYRMHKHFPGMHDAPQRTPHPAGMSRSEIGRYVNRKAG